MAFPPIPRYPNAIDDDRTLFLVYNTTETRISTDNSPWAQEIEIVPVDADKPEIWADNGFANIEGELLYYDDTEKNVNDKVNKLKKCARQLGGEKTKFNKKGTWIRSYVVAEHHNQLVNTVLKIEDFVGYNFDPRVVTLDWRIRNLQALPIIFDDYDCPDIDFTFNIISSDPVSGTIATFHILATPPGSVSTYKLDFGDGNYTTTELDGTHRYAINARIDPVVTVSNDKCQLLQTPVERENPAEPPLEVQRVFEIPVPEIPDIPDFTFVPCDVPEPEVSLPPLIFPCISIEGQIGPIPSVIIGPDINMVSNVTITGPDYPINLVSNVTIIGPNINIPPIIVIDPPIPPTIIIDPPIPPTIVLIPPPSNLMLELDTTELPRLEVDWGIPPNMEVALTLARRVNPPEKFAPGPDVVREFGQEFADLFEAAGTMKVQYEPIGIPEEITIIPPQFPDIKLDAGDVPRTIKVDCTEVKIPTDIRIYGPENPIPTLIRLDGSEVPEDIDLIYRGKPIPVEIFGIPSAIKVETSGIIPERILVETPTPIPEKIIVELKAPESILLRIPEGLGIPVIFPEKMPEVEMVWRGSPIEVKVTMDQIIDKEADGRNCVMITPCPR